MLTNRNEAQKLVKPAYFIILLMHLIFLFFFFLLFFFFSSSELSLKSFKEFLKTADKAVNFFLILLNYFLFKSSFINLIRSKRLY